MTTWEQVDIHEKFKNAVIFFVLNMLNLWKVLRENEQSGDDASFKFVESINFCQNYKICVP